MIECCSPSSVTFVEDRFCLFRTWSFTRFRNDLDSTDNSNSVSSFPTINWCGLPPLWGITTGCPDLSRGITSFTMDCAVPSCWVFSWKKLDWGSRVFLEEVTTGCPDLSHIEVSVFHSGGRPSLVIIPHWVACCEGAFNKLYIIVRRGFWVAAHNGLSRSILSLSFRTPGIFISIASLPKAYWSRGWYVRKHRCNEAHDWSRFCCDSFFSWILLKSFRPCFRARCRTEMADIEQTQHMIPFVTCEISFGENVGKLVFGVNVIDLDLGVQVDSIEQPIKRNSVGPRPMSHGGTPSFEGS